MSVRQRTATVPTSWSGDRGRRTLDAVRRPDPPLVPGRRARTGLPVARARRRQHGGPRPGCSTRASTPDRRRRQPLGPPRRRRHTPAAGHRRRAGARAGLAPRHRARRRAVRRHARRRDRDRRRATGSGRRRSRSRWRSSGSATRRAPGSARRCSAAARRRAVGRRTGGTCATPTASTLHEAFLAVRPRPRDRVGDAARRPQRPGRLPRGAHRAGPVPGVGEPAARLRHVHRRGAAVRAHGHRRGPARRRHAVQPTAGRAGRRRAASSPGSSELAKATDCIATVGDIEVQPGAVNVIPGRADFSLDLRGRDRRRTRRAVGADARRPATTSRRRGASARGGRDPPGAVDRLRRLAAGRGGGGIAEATRSTSATAPSDASPIVLGCGAAPATTPWRWPR